MIYEIRVDNWYIEDFEGPEVLSTPQERLLIKSFAESKNISSKGVRVVRMHG